MGAIVMLGTLFGLIVLITAAVYRFDREARTTARRDRPAR